ncbi:SRPBCC family protein [Flavobacterium caeni]|uniref:GyrI-like small molecule binding domain-containing protein n=1 Tax=Flavobacterium caeni TaxID=490189 RepID=A0A1G5CCM1_9FLAO|nr:SRPBCC family protein [Flavobacterium caeni]SCY00239.1 GyrI-like small molecule binding domain-containing protein [Flavobacterium caeni]
MRILKYIFLLLLLGFFALSVFVATQKGDFEVERSMIIKSPRTTVFNYVNDLRNWENFGSWKVDDPDMQFTYPQHTVGKGGSYAWVGKDGSGKVVTTEVADNTSIRQKMTHSGTVSEVYWTFKDTTGGTKVTWRSKGHMGFGFKVYSAFNGGVDQVIGTMYERSLANLNKSVNYELNTFDIKVDGVVNKTSAFYLSKRITSKIVNVPKNIRILLPQLIHFFKKNKMTIYGKPFVIYHTYDRAKGITDMSVCIPVDKQIFLGQDSDLIAGKLTGFEAVKTTLTGDYSHLQQAWDKGFAYMAEKHIAQSETGPYVELYTTHVEHELHPSKWVTQIYIPVKPKTVAVPKPRVWKPVEPAVVEPAAEVPSPEAD